MEDVLCPYCGERVVYYLLAEHWHDACPAGQSTKARRRYRRQQEQAGHDEAQA
jgi:hypothetical protein